MSRIFSLKSIVGHSLWLEQLNAAGIFIAWSIVASAILFHVVRGLIGVRPSAEAEERGLDLSDHDEEGYIEA